MNKDFSEICTPAKIYFVIAVIASVTALFNGIGLMAVASKLLFAFVWTYGLSWLCQKGYKSLSWFLVLLPYVLIALAAFGMYRASSEHRQLMRATKMQGAFGQDAFGMPPRGVVKPKMNYM